MLELDGTAMEIDAAALVAALSTIFEVAPDRAADACELGANLVVATCEDLDFEEVEPFGAGDEAVGRYGLLVACSWADGYERAVLILVLADKVAECAFELLGSVLGDGPIDLAYLLLREHLVEACEGFAGASEEDDTADGAVYAVNDAHEDVAGLGIFLLDVLLDIVEECAVARLIGLDDFASLLVDGDYVVVFVEDFHGRGLVSIVRRRRGKSRF